MKNAQKNYLDRRLTEVKTKILQDLLALYGVKSYVEVEEKLELILAGKAPLRVTKLKEMLASVRLGHGSWAQWNEIFDFSEQENAIKASFVPVSKATAHVEAIFLQAKDTIMLGSESEALKILQELQSLDVKDIVKKFPPVDPVKADKKRLEKKAVKRKR